jgi:glycerophosphoryl diester phosphodiesterase
MRLSPFGLADSALAPPPDPSRVERLGRLPFAHRGLHGGGRVENSRAAFLAAVEAGHGIELDVQASFDGEAIVFHDYDLARLTGSAGAVAERTAAELRALRLADSDTIPTLADILRLVGSRVPLLIEVKSPDRHVGRLCLAVYRALEGYGGAVGVMSFNPEVAGWFRRNAVHVPRGLVVTENGRKAIRGGFERRLALWRAKPDFLAYDIRDLPSRFAATQRRRGLPIYSWTVRSEAERARAAAHADQIRYEMTSSV